MTVAVLLLHVLGWGTLIVLVAPHDLSAAGGAFGLSVGVTAYVLGARHAFDVDHIATIDNTTRKLVNDGHGRPLSVGFWFSLGHSTVVFVMALLLAIGARWAAGQVSDSSSILHAAAGWIGGLVSGGFLLVLAVLNAVTLIGLIRAQQHSRSADDQAEIENLLLHRGALGRILGPLARNITSPRRMYPIGLLFGLGFDTATEISLLVLSGGASAAGLPWYAILCMPVLFAAGMTLFDSLDGLLMCQAYSWAGADPGRKAFYNIAITALSVAIAFTIGGMQLLGLAADQLSWRGPAVSWISHIDTDRAGLAVAAVMAAIWLLAVLIWKGSQDEGGHHRMASGR